MKGITFSVVLVAWLVQLCYGQSENAPTTNPWSSIGNWGQAGSLEGNSTLAPTISTTATTTTDETIVDDWNATEIPLEPQTAAPTMTPPTASPMAIVQVEGDVSLQLQNTPSLLIGDTESHFLAVVGDFLFQYIQEGVDGHALEIIEVRLVRQYRQPSTGRQLTAQADYHRNLLQNDTTPLYVDLKIVGLLETPDGQTAFFDFDTLLSSLFETQSEVFIGMLQSYAENAFFDHIVAVNVVTQVAAPTSQPTQPTVAPSIFDNIDEANQPDSSDTETSPWSIGVIVGVAAGGAVILMLLLAIVCRLTSNKAPPHEALPDARVTHSESSGGYYDSKNKSINSNGKSTEKKKRWSVKSKEDKPTVESDRTSRHENDPEAPKNITHGEQASLGTVSDLESQGLYSYAKNDSDSVMGASIMYNNSVMGMDNMSYAYSLEPGIEASVVAGYSGDQSTVVHDESSLPRVIPQITVVKNKKSSGKRGGNNGKTTPKSGVQGNMNSNIQDTAREFQMSTSDLELTESELAMLPSNLRDSNDEDDSRAATPPTRVVMAPSGKLGIVIDTTVDGPVVHHVNESSALKGKIFPGDIIVGIDNVDTRAMSASAITALMVKTAHQKRRLTILENKKGKLNKPKTSNGGKR